MDRRGLLRAAAALPLTEFLTKQFVRAEKR
ncbi:hypothetical protein ABIA06_004002 [Bradyrhizobium yuanmingense]